MRVLVTGGNGYIGQSTVKELLLRNHHPVVIDNLSAGNLLSIPIDDFIWEDIRYTNLESILIKYNIEAVIHLAALASVPNSIDKPLEYYDVNVKGTLRLLEAMNKTNVKRIVFASTGAINSDTPYGHTKSAGEKMVGDILDEYVVLRYLNVVGSKDHSKEHVLPRILKASENNLFLICGDDYDTRDGTCERDYVSVKDVASANCIAVENADNLSGNCYEVGTGIGTTVLELNQECSNVWFDFTGRRPGDETSLVADVNRRLPGWKPQYNLKSIISEVLQK